MVLSSPVLYCQGRGGRHLLRPPTDTVRIIKEYGIDSALLSTSRQQMINGCWKELQYLQFDESGNLKLQRTTRYASEKNNTCDFTPYIEYIRVYEKKNLYKEYSRQAACAECEARPCGVEIRRNPSGKIVYQRSYGKCSFKTSASQPY